MTEEHLRRYVDQGESETLEFKQTTGERRAGAQTLCAMLNTRGGRVIFGVTDSGVMQGQQIGVRTLEDLSATIAEIDPPVYPSIEAVTGSDGREFIVVQVSQGQNRPYSIRGLGYARVGRTTLTLSRDQQNSMLFERIHSERRWENQIAEGWSVEDLDVQEVLRTLDETIRRGRGDDPGTRDVAEILSSFNLIKDGQLLRAAAVLFGKRQRLESDYPQCLLRVARFVGTTKTEFIDNRQIHGNLFELMVQAERFMRTTLPIAGMVTANSIERYDSPAYPPVALREALANAVCHRDYSIGGGSIAIGAFDDRLEVTSSGGLHFGLTADALFEPHESLPWNPIIARVMFRRGFIEQWGRGTLKIAELTHAVGLPRPEILDEGGCVTVRFKQATYMPPMRVAQDLTEPQRAILGILNRHPEGLALRFLRAMLPGDPYEWTVKNDLATLKGLGLVSTSGHGRGASWSLLRGES